MKKEIFIQNSIKDTQYKVYDFRMEAWKKKLENEANKKGGQTKIKKLIKAFYKLEDIKDGNYKKLARSLKNDWDIVMDMAYYFNSDKTMEFAKYFAENCKASQNERTVFSNAINTINAQTTQIKEAQQAQKAEQERVMKVAREKRIVEKLNQYKNSSYEYDINEDSLFTE